MTNKSVVSTAHRALALPEIVGEILFSIYNNRAIIWCRTRTLWLLNCALVNKTWCNEALRILWGDMEDMGPYRITLDEAMINISPDRRQIYANFVKTATVTTYSQETESVVQPALENLVFPQVHTLRLILVFHNMDTQEGIRTPVLNMPNLQVLYVDRSIGPIYLYPGQWDCLADQIPKLFPTLLDVRVEIPAILHITGFETLSENMPHLESLEFEELLDLSDVEDTFTDDDDLDDEDAHSEDTDEN